MIGHVYTTNPAQGERHYLCMPLHHVSGPKCYEDLQTFPDGTYCTSFKGTAMCMDLLATDNEWDESLEEASALFLPYQIRSLFVTILVFGEPTNPEQLWEKYKDTMREDIMWKTLKSGTVDKSKLDEYVGNSVLLLIEDDLMQLGSCLENFGLPKANRSAISVQNPQVIQDELYNTSDQKAKSLEKLSCLNSEQQQAHEKWCWKTNFLH